MSILKEKTRKLLQSLTNISNSVIVTYPEMCVKDGKAIQAYFNLEKLGEDKIDQEFAIYGITDFLTASSLVNNPTIELKEKQLVISNGKEKITYNTSNIALLEEQCRGDFELITRIKSNDCIAEFELTSDSIKTLKHASNALKDLPNLEIENSGENEVILKIAGFEKSSNSYSTSTEAKIIKDFKIILLLSLLKKIPNGNFEVKIFQSKKGSKVALFVSKDIEGLEFVISLKDVN